VGEFLGGDENFNLAVLKAFAKLTLKGHIVGFQDAIRLYLSRFRLPGEAQKIDRILEAFANSYYQVRV
jgi:Sec7-like guanine-nucleotide exchange factor